MSTGSNLNINLALAFTFMGSAARGVWSFATLTNYLEGMTGSVLSVGIAEGVQGICQALVALLAGWYADKFSRDSVLQFAGVLGLLTVAGMLLTILIPGWDFHNPGDPVWSWMDSSVRYPLLVGALGCWGAYQGVWNTSLETIFADSVPMGQRSLYNTRKFVLLQMASISGPVVAICLFLATNDNWGQHTLTFVFFCGLLATVPSITCLFFFRDDLALPRGGASAIDAVVDGDVPTPSNGAGAGAPGSSTKRSSRPESVQLSSGITPLLTSTHPVHMAAAASRASPGCCCRCLTKKYVPHVIVFSDLISGFGSGMTVKFFPLFFSQKLKLSPIATNCIYIAVPIFMTLASLCAQTLSRKWGRVQISMLYAYVGALALLGMWILGVLSNDHFDEWNLGAVLPLYFISTAQHCVRPLKKSILMDYVQKEQRARWNSLDSVTRFGWSGSAVVGGWIVDKWNYGGSFFITAIIQVLASTMLVLLVPLVPPVEKQQRSLSHVSRTTSAGFRDPLLLPPSSDEERSIEVESKKTKGEEAMSLLNSTWHADHESWRSPSMGSDPTECKVRSRSFDDHETMMVHMEEDRQESCDSISMAVHDALAEMQSPLMNSFVRRGDR